MARFESISLIVSIVILAVSIIFSIMALTGSRTSSKQAAGAGGLKWDNTGVIFTVIGLIFLTLSIVARAIQTGHGPFSNMYEFSIAFSWGIVAMGLFFQWRYNAPIVKAIALAVAVILLIYANTLPTKPVPLVPALQQSYLLSVHVAFAIIAYGTFTTGFGAALLYLFQRKRAISWMPSPETLDDMSYHAVIVGFPCLTLVIVLGALWADIAWGRYWGWDPKETASLVTWLFYAAYLHARVMRGWRGSKTAVLMIIGFLAVIFTFFGNYIFSGLHAYT